MPGSEQGAVSTILSLGSLASWIFLLLPQQIRHYRRKSVEDVSPYLLLFLFIGDLLNLTGCLMTHQLYFQIWNSCYSISNDLVLFFQYWYYSTYYDKKHAIIAVDEIEEDEEMMESSIGSLHSNLFLSGILLGSQLSGASAMPIMSSSSLSTGVELGRFFAFGSSACYIIARFPQLYKNYKNRSTRGVSPYFHGLAIMGCMLYSLSILTSNKFMFNHDPVSKWTFFRNELPYMIGNLGSVLLDLVFFYQYFVFDEIEDATLISDGYDRQVDETTNLLD